MQTFFHALCQRLGISTEKNPDHLSPLTLAFVGDTVFDLAVRTLLIETHDATVQQLHRMSSARVRAAAQAAAALALWPGLSEREQAIFMRGRNAKPGTIPKHARPEDYALATALECLLGWLFLRGDEKRLLEILQQTLEKQPDRSAATTRPFRP